VNVQPTAVGLSLRRRRQHKAWGVAQRNPRGVTEKNRAHEVGGGGALQGNRCERMIYIRHLCIRFHCRPFHGLGIRRFRSHLGFRCAPPQALCCRPLRGLRENFVAYHTFTAWPTTPPNASSSQASLRGSSPRRSASNSSSRWRRHTARHFSQCAITSLQEWHSISLRI
jgi:hypothetical protein